MPLTGLVAEARKRTAQINEKRDNLKPAEVKQEVKRALDLSSEIEQASKEKQFHWRECKSLKSVGDRNFCKRYVSLCAEEQCNNKFREDEKELDFKRILRGK